MSDRTPADELFARWLASQQQGQPAVPEELCHACPDQLPALLALIRAYQLGQQTLSRPPQPIGEATLSVAPSPESTVSHRSQPVASHPTSIPQLPDYFIERELGRGGMGVVYLANDLKLNRPVAIKMVLHGSSRGRVLFSVS